MNNRNRLDFDDNLGIDFLVSIIDNLCFTEIMNAINPISKLVIKKTFKMGQEPTNQLCSWCAYNGSEKPYQARLISLSHHPFLKTMSDETTLPWNATGDQSRDIGTLECSTSSRLCGQWLNSSGGRNSAAVNRKKPLVTLAMWTTPSIEGGRLLSSLQIS